MTAALKTGPHSGCLKELCVISSTKLWMDGLGTADTETARGARDLASLLAWEVAGAAGTWGELLRGAAGGRAQCSILLLMSWNPLWRAASKSTDCCF